MPDAILGYPSSGYMDDLAWGAAWLHARTGEDSYLQDALSWFSASQFNASQTPESPMAWDYDNQLPGTAVLLANFSGWQNRTILPQVGADYGSCKRPLSLTRLELKIALHALWQRSSEIEIRLAVSL